MDKPPLFLKLWCWMLLQASHKDHGDLKRGQFFTSIEEMRSAMAYKAGYRVVKPSKKEVRTAYESLTRGTMIGTMKVTHGMVITIRNYNLYQDPGNYEGHNEGRDEIPSRGTIPTRRVYKNIKTPGNSAGPAPFLEDLRQRYDQSLIDQTFEAIASTRKTGRVAESILLAQLQAWERYPVKQVEAGLKTYLAKGYAGQGKDEKYLAGIIRNGSKVQLPEPPAGKEWYEEAGAI